MSSDLYNSPVDVAPATRARSTDINSIDAATQTAFDKLPNEAQIKRETINYAATTGNGAAFAVALPYAATSYVDGMRVAARFNTGNTTAAPTINVNGLGAKPIITASGTGPAIGTLSGVQELRYDASAGAFQVLGTVGIASSVPEVSGTLNLVEGAPIASAATVNLDAATGNTVHITGATNITAITLTGGRERTIIFDGATTIIHGASLRCPGGRNIITAPGDSARVFATAGVTYLTDYLRADGLANVSPGRGGTTATLAANYTLQLDAASAGVQAVTPLGLGASIQLPPANTLAAAVAAAYVGNQSGTYQLGVRDGAGTLRAALPAGAGIPLSLANTSNAAGVWMFPGGHDDGVLLAYEVALPAGFTPVYWDTNLPEYLGKPNRWFVALSATLAVGLVKAGSGTYYVIAFNPTTGAIGSAVACSTTGADDFFRLEAVSATSAMLVYCENYGVGVGATVRARMLTVAGTMVTMQTLYSGPVGGPGGTAITGLSTLRLSGGSVVVMLLSGTSPHVIGIAAAGNVLTVGGAYVSAGSQANGYLPPMYEVAASVFTYATVQNNSRCYVHSFTINAATGAITTVTSNFDITGSNNMSANPVNASMVKLTGTTRWFVAAPAGVGGLYYVNLVNIDPGTGTIGYVLGGAAANYQNSSPAILFTGAAAPFRIPMVALSATRAALITTTSSGGGGQAQLTVFTDNNNGTFSIAHSGAIGFTNEARAQSGMDYTVVSGQQIKKFTVGGSGATVTTTTLQSVSSGFGTPTAYIPIGTDANVALTGTYYLVNKRRGRETAAKPAVSSARPGLILSRVDEIPGCPYIVGTDNSTGHILLLEFAQ